MNKRNRIKAFVGTAVAAAAVIGTVSFTAITAIADEAVNYYGVSAGGTVLSGTVTEYTEITSADTAWGTAGNETWYVADGNIDIDNYDFRYCSTPVEINGSVNIILKNGARVTVNGGVKGTDAELTVYNESADGDGIIAFIGAGGANGDNGTIYSGEEASHGKTGEYGLAAVDISSLTVAGGTVTAVGGKGGNGGQAGYGADWVDGVEVFYYGKGGNGGDGAYAVTENTDIYLNGGRFNATAGRGGSGGENPYVPSEQENYKGTSGNSGTAALKGIYAVNGILNVNKLDDSDDSDTTGDFELLSVDAYENALLSIIGGGTAKVNSKTVITTHGDISVSGRLSVDGGMILTNGDIIKDGSAADVSRTNGGIIRRITPAAEEGYTLDNSEGSCVPESDYNIMLSDGTLTHGFVGPSVIMSESNRLKIIRCGDGDIIDNSEPFENVMPYCFSANDTPHTFVTGGNVFAKAGTNSRFTFALNDPDEYIFSGITVTDPDGNTVPADKYTFDKQTGEFTVLSVDRNMILTANAQLKDVEISVTDNNNTAVSSVDIVTEYDNGASAKSATLKIKVTEGGSITKYRVVKESDLDKSTGEITDTSSFAVSYFNGGEWGIADDGSLKITKNGTATFTIRPDNDLAAGEYTENFIVITDRSEYADTLSGSQDKALTRFTVTYTVVHESDNKLHYSDLTWHYNLCKNCSAKINEENHTFDVKIVNDATFAKAADCTKPAEYFFSCECGAYTNDMSLTFESGNPNGHSFGEWTESKAADCTQGGKEKRICSVCKAEEERDTAALGHDWGNDFTVDLKPTCTKPGSKSIHCLRCDVTKDETEIASTGHTFGEWTENKAADCTQGGKEKRICSVCKAEEERDTAALGHDWDNDFTVDLKPTCTKPGSKSVHCLRCDVTKDKTEIAPTGHTFGEWAESKVADCTQCGKEKRICSACKAEEERDTAALGHDWDNDFTVDLKPTCTKPGSKSVHCLRCDVTKDETEIAPTGHTFGEWAESKAADCTQGGKEKRICSACKAQEERDTAALGHDWDNDFTIDLKPTCTNPGSKSIHCLRCDVTKDETEIAPTGHTFGEWTESKAADCMQGGKEKRICSACKAEEERDTAALGHDWDNDFTVDLKPTCTKPGSKSVHCLRCDVTKDKTEIAPTGHTFGEWTVSEAATCVAGGQKIKKCTICGYTEYDGTAVDPDGHVWNSDYTVDKEPTCTEEGSKSIHCSLCDATKDSTVIPVTEHTYGDWEVVTPSTCTKNGVKRHACIRCGFEQTGVIDAAHEWENFRTTDILPSCTEVGEDSVHCKNCSVRTDIKTLSANGHKWSEWKTIRKSTATEKGLERRNCLVCGITEEKELDLLQAGKWNFDGKKHWHKDDDGNITDIEDHEFKWVVDKEPTADEPGIGHYECISCAFEQAPEEFLKMNPETGSESLALLLATAFLAGAAVPVTIKKRNRKK